MIAAASAGRSILAPSTELAAALFAAIERSHLKSGRGVWPTPSVVDFGTWLRDGYAARQLADAGSPRLLGEFEERELWRAAIESSDLGRDILEPGGAARAARRARRAVCEYGIPWRAVAEHASATDEARVFLDWNRRFDERCRDLDCISADALPARIAAPAQPFAWIDSPAWRPMARHWLELHGQRLAPPFESRRNPRRVHAPSLAAELVAAADWAAAHLRGSETFRAWICVPELNLRRSEVVDAFDAVLAPQRFGLREGSHAAPYAVAGGTPLAEFAPVRAALDTLTAAEGPVPFERFSALLRSPELQADAAESGAAARLDLELRRRGPAESDLAAWLVLAERLSAAQGLGAVAAVQRLQGALRVLDELRGGAPLSRWVAAWIRCFESGPWALRHRWSSVEYQAAERLRELLAALGAGDAFFGTHSRRSAQHLLRRAARDTAFQPQTGIPAIWVSGQLTDPWLNYDGVWANGCDAESWPPPVDPIALLPVGLQRDFGVISAAAESQLQFALELQDRWMARAGQCVFSYADRGGGRRAVASPLLPDGPVTPAAALPQPHWHALLRAAPPLERYTDDVAPRFGAEERTRGVATLRAQSRCPFRGFAETRLGTQRLERPVPGFNDRERGELIHHALEHVWSVLGSSSNLHAMPPQDAARLIDDAAARALARIRRIRDPGARWRERERERMRNVLGKWLDAERQRQPFAVEHLEQAAQVTRHAGLEFKVRIDRVDRLTDGARVLIDYKTGSVSADWRGDRPDNPQLPLYALLQPEALVAVAYGRVNAAACGFLAEAERPAIFSGRGQKTSLEGSPDLASLIEVWSRRIGNLAADFAAGHAAVTPTVRACKSCWLQGLCRVAAPLEDADAHE